MNYRVAGRIRQAQFQDVPVVLVDELPEDLFGLFVETASWLPNETAQQTEHTSDEHTGNEHAHQAQEVTASAVRLDDATVTPDDCTQQHEIHPPLDEEEANITARTRHTLTHLLK